MTMKYLDIIGVQNYFRDVYDITDEPVDYWKQFIPTEKFYDVLNATLENLESSEPKNIWVQGTYGTGKSHSSAVVMHLLWDDLAVIGAYLNSLRPQIKQRLKNFRNTKKAFPVVLKGISDITDNRTFSLVVERAVKDSLKKHKIKLTTESDFEVMISKLQDRHINWDSLIEENREINMYEQTTSGLIKRLEQQDITILKTLESVLSRKGWHFSYSDISKWLAEVVQELRDKKEADSLMIFWDEFTPLLEMSKNSEILSQLQNIAELSRSKKISLFIVSHRKPSQAGLVAEDAKKVFDRFHIKDYSMEPITTYHIISSAILKKDEAKYLELKKLFYEKYPNIETLIKEISGNENANIKTEIKNIFPIHPFTAYVATFIARNLGSTQRSIFGFLNDKENGFANFLNNDISSNIPILTSDYLWNFFINELKSDTYGKFSAIISKFISYNEPLEKKGAYYSAIFKGILLLNALHTTVAVEEAKNSLVAPSLENIKFMFMGTEIELHIENVLDYIDAQEIIRKNPSKLFLVSSTVLPFREVEQEKEKVKKEFENITKVLDTSNTIKLNALFNAGVLRSSDISLFWAGEQENVLKNKIINSVKKSYALNFVVFVSKDDSEISVIKTMVNKIGTKDEAKNIIFVVPDEPLGGDRFSRYISYIAEARIAQSHNAKEEAVKNQGDANKIVEAWINAMKTNYLSVFLNGDPWRQIVSGFGSFVNAVISPKIFKYGLENLKEITKNQNLWKYKNAEKAVEIFLFTNTLDEIKAKTRAAPNNVLRNLLMNKQGKYYIVEDTLEIKESADTEHPLVKIMWEIENRSKDLQDLNFHLGEKLKFLSEPPYGVYKNMANMALVGFIMRRFVDKLYDEGTGRLVRSDIMRDKIIELFKYWEGGYSSKLDVRFGTLEEKELCNILKKIFPIENKDGLNNVRWEIKEFINRNSYPVWTLKLLCKNDSVKSSVDEIFKLTKAIDKELGLEDIKQMLNIIRNNVFDLELLVKPQNLAEGFRLFMKNVESACVQESEIDDVLSYLNQSMQEAVSSWEEEKVKSNIIEWRLIKTLPIPSDTQPEPHELTPPTPKPQVVNEVKTKVNAYSGDLKKLILKIIDENPYLASVFSKYFE